MRIGIYTQKLENNYGGILQNYALQYVLKSLGHTPITFDYRPRTNYFWYILSQAKNVFLRLLGKKRKIHKYKKGTERSVYTQRFIRNNIKTSWRMQFLNPLIPYLLRIDCALTGSDQVWRPSYNILSYAYLHFVTNRRIPKVAYAASFGVDTWEYSKVATQQCQEWIKCFKAVSVREDSGIALCKNYLHVDAIHVLDPTMLLTRDIYEALCVGIKPLCEKPFLAAYVLDLDEDKERIIVNIAKRKGLSCMIFSAEKNISLTVEQWLSIYRDADYVVTDSFHGTVFSIIFRKSFNTIINHDRGSSRFDSLLSIFDLRSRLVDESEGLFNLESIKWTSVENILSEWKIKSINYLKNNLYK